jgi:chromosome segregation ATPase
MNLDFLRGRRATEEQQNTEARRTAANVSAELDLAKAAVDTVAQKIVIAQEELEHARAQYDASVNRYALCGGREPDHTAVEKEISKLEALRRVLRDQQAAVARLGSELAQAQRAENAASEEATTETLIADAEQKLETFAQLAKAAKGAETELFNALYRSALKDGGIGSRARDARRAIAQKVIEGAKEIGYRINPDFETDGRPNLADPDRAWQAHVQDTCRDAARYSECPPYDPSDVGSLIPEEIER